MGYDDPFHALLPYLPYIILLLILFRRARTARVLRPGRLWIGPVILLIPIAFFTWAAMRKGVSLHAQDWLIVLACAGLGAAVGVLRARLVHVTVRPDGQLETRLNLIGAAFIIVWVAGRQWLRNSGWVNAHDPFGVYAFSGLALAVGLVIANALVLSRRCQALLAENKPLTASIPGGAV